MSGLKGAAKNAASFMTSSQNIEKIAQKFTHPTASPGKTTWPTSQKKLKNVGFHFDLSDVTKTIPDTRSNSILEKRHRFKTIYYLNSLKFSLIILSIFLYKFIDFFF